MDALDFQKLIEHTLKNDTRHPCFILPGRGARDHITPQNPYHSHWWPWSIAYVT